MAVSNLVRNLRDAELVLIDGTTPTPSSLTVILDEGDLSWTESVNTIEVKDRGSIAAGHLRPGDDESVSLSFSAKWTQLFGKSVDSGDPLQLYEFLTHSSAANVVSTSSEGEQQTLTFEFTVIDPAGVAGEKITFPKVYRENLTLSESEDYNLITYSGKAFASAPTITRV